MNHEYSTWFVWKSRYNLCAIEPEMYHDPKSIITMAMEFRLLAIF